MADFGTVAIYSAGFLFGMFACTGPNSLHPRYDCVGRITTPLHEDNRVGSPLET